MKPKQIDIQISLTWRIAIIFSLVFSIIFLLTLASITYQVTRNADEQIMEDLKQVLEGTANGVDVEMLMDLADNGKPNEQGFSDDPRYIAIMDWLETVHSAEPDAWPYLYIPAEKPGHIFFVVDLQARYDASASSSFMEEYKSNSGYILVGLEEQTFRAVDSPIVAGIKNFAVLFDGDDGGSKIAAGLNSFADWLAGRKLFAPNDFGTYQDQFGRWASGYMPLVDSEGQKVAGIGVDFEADTINLVRSEVRSTVIYSFVGSYLVLLPLVIWISFRLTKPIKELTETAKLIGANNHHLIELPLPSNKKFKDEIDILEQVLFYTYQKLQNANQQLQGLSHQLISDREQYRKELARDLHDNVLSYLSVLASNQPADLDPAAMQENYKQVVSRLRATIFSLRSPMMEYGLPMAVEDFIDGFDLYPINEDMKISVEIPPTEVRYDNKIETHVFRIIQQAIENAMEHSNASQIKIYGKFDQDHINISIEDDGDGILQAATGEIDLDRYEARRKYGMVGMIERAALIDAELEIQQGDNGGTSVHLHWDA